MYTVYMPKPPQESTVLTIRVSPALSRRLDREARRLRQTRSEAARAILETALQGTAVEDPAAEARRQSLLASSRESENDVLDFITSAADLRGWK